jgi:hypothetical protein
MSRYDHKQDQAAPLPVPNNWGGVFQVRYWVYCLTWDDSSTTYLGGQTWNLKNEWCNPNNRKQYWYWDNNTATLRAAAKKNFIVKSSSFED